MDLPSDISPSIVASVSNAFFLTMRANFWIRGNTERNRPLNTLPILRPLWILKQENTGITLSQEL